jgi:hypothetical protein
MAKQFPTGPVNTARPPKKSDEPVKAPAEPIDPAKRTWTQYVLKKTSCQTYFLTLCRRYLALNRRTRIIIGLGVVAYAGVMLYLSDQAEETFGLKATEEEQKKLRDMLPKVYTVDRSNPRS